MNCYIVGIKQPHITPKELKIATAVKLGLSSKEIANKFGMAIKTVEAHRHNILKKLGLRNTAALVN